METIFESIFSNGVTISTFFIMLGVALVTGVLYAFLMSLTVRSSKRFFLVNAILPPLIASIICFVSGNIGAGIAIGGAFALIRFRSAQGSADEIASIFITMVGGVAFGTGYLAYGVVLMLVICLIYLGLSHTKIFEHKKFAEEKLLKITIPESLEYDDAFIDTFAHYLKENELVGVKLTGMGSLYRLSYRIKMKNPKEEKELIDELRIKNGNLEISILPYVEKDNSL